MGLRDDESGQAIQIGALFLFATLIISFSTYQAFYVPQQNSEIEFDAYESSRNDMTQLRSSLVATGTRGSDSITDIKLGATYPARIVAVNPAPPSGRLSTGTPRNVTFENVSAVESEAVNTQTYWNVSGAKTFENATKGILFRPNYNEFSADPIGITGESAYVVGDGNPAVLAGSSLVSGNRIRLIFIQGNLTTSGQSASVVAHAESTSLRTVTVTGQGGPLTITFDPPPGITADGWVNTLGQRLRNTNQRVLDVRNETGTVLVELNGSRNYQLQLASVQVNTQESDVGTQDPRYIIAHQGDDQVIFSGKRGTVIPEVRDKFNNPVGDADVRFNITGGDARLLDENGDPVSGTRTIATNSEGRAPMSLIVEGSENNVFVEATIVNETGTLNSTTFELQVSQSPGQQEGAGAYLISISNAEAESPDGSGKGMQFVVRNQDDDRNMTITRYAVERVTANMERFDRDNQASAIWQYPLTIDVGNDSTVDGYVNVNQMDVGTTYSLTSTATLEPNQKTVFRDWESANPGQDMEGEFVEVTLYFEMEGSNEEISATTTLFLF